MEQSNRKYKYQIANMENQKWIKINGQIMNLGNVDFIDKDRTNQKCNNSQRKNPQTSLESLRPIHS